MMNRIEERQQDEHNLQGRSMLRGKLYE